MLKIQSNILKNISHTNWDKHIGHLIKSQELTGIYKYLKAEHNKGIDITPSPSKLFKAFEICDANKLKVVIVGMDPYPKKGVANGVAFCCKDSSRIEKSLQYINKDISETFDVDLVLTKDLTFLAEQGVLLLNGALTCVVGKPGSHTELWFGFMARLLNTIAVMNHDVIFVFMGAKAKLLSNSLPQDRKIFLTSHPASAVYSGGKWDSKKLWLHVNKELHARNKQEISWF